MPGQRSATIGFWVGVGSRDEAPGQHGSTHFLEHLLFKGTKRRTALEIASAFDEVGGESNAATAKESTCYFARVLDTDLPMAIDVIADMITVAGADRVLSMDLHQGQIQGFFNIPVDELTAVHMLSNYFINKHIDDCVVVTDLGFAKRARAFAEILDENAMTAGFYGHCSVGCLHIRPFVDLSKPDEVARMRTVAVQIKDLVREFGGANSSEHGDGRARSEFNREIFGDDLIDLLDSCGLRLPELDYDDEAVWPPSFFAAVGGRRGPQIAEASEATEATDA